MKISTPFIYGISKSPPFLLAIKCAVVFYFISTSVICLFNKTIFAVLYCIYERLDQPESHHMQLITYGSTDVLPRTGPFSRIFHFIDLPGGYTTFKNFEWANEWLRPIIILTSEIHRREVDLSDIYRHMCGEWNILWNSIDLTSQYFHRAR